MNTFLTLGGRITCTQCQAQSKRTKQQCRAPAIRGKNVCRTHGGLSTGPKTSEGRKRCAAAKTVHSRETRAKRAEYREKMKEIYELEEQGRAMGMIVGPKTAGRKPR
jgi:hypothetical protein